MLDSGFFVADIAYTPKMNRFTKFEAGYGRQKNRVTVEAGQQRGRRPCRPSTVYENGRRAGRRGGDRTRS
ncbi:protein of unknown function [Paraburkholderia dioscoreae]|uniref:Uncharacterized protein n=1 Tax=Paraburkholderia dioscoreae TaxID=2604047 RepID=A0A5Q4ZKY9_9BURK|nr:protein of unknown function [Paraburkholderia dioscoreae]